MNRRVGAGSVPGSRNRLIVLSVVAIALVGAMSSLIAGGDPTGGRESPGRVARTLAGDRVFESNDPIERSCALNRKILVRLWRGLYKRRGGDLMMVPQRPNYAGGFVVPGHTGPWDYLQEVPLVLYGPRIASRGEVSRHATIADVFPTVGELTRVDLPERDGHVLREALRENLPGVPKLVVTVVWDGVVNIVLERWPGRWPVLQRLMERGTAYIDASVGSSPSITPATHATLGTGSFPRGHGITAINLRSDDGAVTTALLGRDPRDLELTTYADEIDRALRNAPKVGMIAWVAWHMAMLGHGTLTPGGDADELGLLGVKKGDVEGREPWYSTPSYLDRFPGLKEHAREVDRQDGKADGKWMGHELLELHADPAWIAYEGDAVHALLKRGGYGLDRVPDLFLTNFKVADVVGHYYTMESKEMGEVVAAQDRELGRILSYLDRRVRDYVVIVTADHGHTPPSWKTGGWPLVIKEVRDDINRHFDVPPERSLIDTTSPAGLFFDYEAVRRSGVSEEAIAEFVNGYTIRENWPKPELPEGFAERGDEHVFSAAFLRTQVPEIMRCAFGAPEPPPGFDA